MKIMGFRDKIGYMFLSTEGKSYYLAGRLFVVGIFNNVTRKKKNG